MHPTRAVRLAIAFAIAIAAVVPSRTARAEGPPPAPNLPAQLTLDQALTLLRTRGLDTLIAEAQVRSAEGDVSVAGAVPNPAVNLGYGRVLNYQSCDGCSPNQYTVGISDQAAIEDSLSGKRGLRLRVARNALAAAKLARTDALRSLEFQVKQQYAQVAQALAALRFEREVVESLGVTLDLNRQRYPKVIDEGALARIETQKLEADQAYDQAAQSLRAARVGLAFLLGVRGEVPDFDVDEHLLEYRVPSQLALATEGSLIRSAAEHRPDLQQYGYERARAEAAVALARRQRFPDITLSAQYTQTGTGGSAIQPPTISFGVSAPVPLFYQQQGEIRKAEADYDTQALTHAKVAAQVVSDVSTAFSSFSVARRLVERMEQGGLLSSAKKARDITEIQFKAGAGTLIDFLDAQRTYISTKVEYLQDLTSYWTAVYQLEQAVGTELR